MPLFMKCSLCGKEINSNEEYFDIMLNCKTVDHGDDSLDSEYNDFCEECVMNTNIAKLLLNKMNKRNPNPNKKEAKE